MNFKSIFEATPPVTKNLIIINLIVWLGMMVIPGRLDIDILRYGALHYFEAPDFNAAQLFTYMFMHDTRSIAHLFFNMFTLFMFGITLERILGSGRFLFYYITCGLGAALIQEGVWALTWRDTFIPLLAQANGISVESMTSVVNQAIVQGQELPFLNEYLTIGASGAVFGVLLAFGMIFPNRPMYIMFIPVPVNAKWVVIGYGVIELLLGVSGNLDNVAHYAHLGGMLFGFFLILYWKRKGVIHGDYY